MKKDRLDELLGHIVSEKNGEREVYAKGLHRFTARISGDGIVTTVLDSLLSKALVSDDILLTTSQADEGMRRLRNRLEQRPSQRESPAFRPAFAFATLAVVIIALALVVPLTKTSDRSATPVGGYEETGFAAALKTRNDIIARLPGAISSSSVETPGQELIAHNLARENRRLDSLDAFANEVCGESFAKRVGGNRRTILAKLSGDRGDAAETNIDSPVEPLSPTSRQRILLNDKLNRVSEGF